MAGPVGVLAAKPDADATATAVLDRVSPSTDAQASYIAFEISFALHPDEPSNLAQLYLLADTPSDWDLWAVDEATRPGCDATGEDLFCSFGSIDADDPAIELTVVYKLGTDTGNVSVPFLFNTTGVAGDPKGRSHGDAYPAPASVIVENDKNFGASYPQAVGDVISDSTALSRNNPQYTKVFSPAEDIIVTVGEDESLAECQALFGGCFGQASVLNVANGLPFAGGFQAEVGYNLIRPQAQIVHFFDPGVTDPETGLGYEELGSCGSTPVAPCASVTTSDGKTIVTVYLLQNGKIFGH